MTPFSICCGSYSLPEFIALNLAQCRDLLGDAVPIIVADDRSAASEQIREVAADREVAYVCSERRRSHFSGDWQAIMVASKWAADQGAPVAIKLSQRLIPLHRRFFEKLLNPFDDPKVAIVLPGRPEKHQFARPESTFYHGFGHLTDVVAFRPEVLTPEFLEQVYRERASGKDKKKGDRLVEVAMGWVIANCLRGWKAVLVDELANHRMGEPRLYLRKAQSNRGEYLKLAEKHGIPGDFDLREWAIIERKGYIACGPMI